jgi:hypothetical protein
VRESFALGFGIAIALLVSSACAGSGPKHEYTLTPGQGYHPGFTKVLIVPINETADVPAGLDVANDRVEQLLDDYLQLRGVSIERPQVQKYRRAAKAATRLAKADANARESGTVSEALVFGDTIPQLVEYLEVEADLVIVPNLVMRTGQATGGRTYKWDGVRRYETGNVHLDMTGDFPVASLFVVVYKSDGSRVFSGYGGLDTVFEVSLQRHGMFLREDLLENERHLKQGICIAFYPYFGEQERC